MTTNDPSHNLLIVSDLHLSEGFSIHEGKFSRLEDFFSDQPFADFLAHHRDNREEDRPWRLIIAGDLFDFLQVTAVPAATPDKLWAKLMNWQANELSAYNQVSELNKRARLVTLNQWMVEIQQTLSQRSAPTFSKLDESLQWLQRKSRKELSGEEVWLLEELVMETWILVNTEKGELTDRTQKYVLGTTWQETVWKLDRNAEWQTVYYQA
jgi:hypothetical protein